MNALGGRGVHVVTVNDYLARRDSEQMGRVHRFLGLDVGVILADKAPDERRLAYHADITYGTNNEFGFDYLGDNMADDASQWYASWPWMLLRQRPAGVLVGQRRQRSSSGWHHPPRRAAAAAAEWWASVWRTWSSWWWWSSSWPNRRATSGPASRGSPPRTRCEWCSGPS